MSEHFISRDDAETGLLDCAAYLAETINSSEGHAEAMMAVVPCYLANGDVDLAAVLANTVDDPFARDKLLTLVAVKCAASDDDEYARQLIESVEDFGLQSEGRERIGLIKAGKAQHGAAREIADAMPHPDFVYAGIAARQFTDGDLEGFRLTVSEIEFPSARVSAFLTVAQTAIADNAEITIEMLQDAAANAAEIEHDEEKIRTLIEIGGLFLEANRNDRAIETFDKAREYAEGLDNVHRDAFFAGVSVGFLRAGSQDLSDRALDQVADKTQIANCLLGHARHYWESDLNEDAIESLEEAYAILRSQKEIETRNSKERFGLLSSIAAQFAGFEKGERGIGVAESIEDESESMSALSQIAAVLSLQNEDDLARRALNAIPEDGKRVFALIGMSDAKAKNELNGDAASLLDEALHLTETVPQLASRSSAYNAIAKRFLDLGNVEAAHAAAKIDLETIASIRDESSRAALLAQLSQIYETAELKLDDSQLGVIRKLIAPSL